MARPWQLLRVVMVMMAGEMAAVAQCPAGYETHPLILMSLDGFRADYLDRGLTPSLKALADRGVHATYMVPSYPTLTFPNHYTIVTVCLLIVPLPVQELSIMLYSERRLLSPRNNTIVIISVSLTV